VIDRCPSQPWIARVVALVGEAPGRRRFDHPGKASGREWRARTACTHAAMIARAVSFGVARGVRMTEFPFTDCAIAEATGGVRPAPRANGAHP
jgi:hypothetical protein